MERTGVSVIAALTGLCLLVAIGYVEAGGRHELPSDFLEQKPSEDALLKEKRPILQQSIVDTVNSQRSTWKAGHNPRFDGFTVKDFKRLCGTFKGLPIAGVDGQEEERPPVVSRRASSKVKLPESFDAREEWPRCKSIGTILDQGHCGSCWAFGTVESLSDRFCIHGLENVTLSENDLLACCGFECGFGCDGGYPYRAWQYFQRTGVVSSSCDPYFDDIGCGHPGCSPVMPTPACVKSCMSTDDLWTESKHYGTSAYFISSDPEELKLELYTNGPFNVDFDVFEDFAHYTSGVYQHTTGAYMGGHAVKLIGWGTEDGLDYWTIVNSWNEDWGENGLFRIVRGTNDCGIESDATGGMPFVRGGESSSM